MSARRPQVVVIGDGQPNSAAEKVAEALGRRLAEAGITLITGGRGGVMEAASRGAQTEGGLVVGILPGTDPNHGNPYCSITLPTGMGHGRNHLNVLAADAVVVLGGRAGTLSELSFAWIHHKPILAVQGTGGMADQYANQSLDNRNRAPIVAATSPEEVMGWLQGVLQDRAS